MARWVRLPARRGFEGGVPAARARKWVSAGAQLRRAHAHRGGGESRTRPGRTSGLPRLNESSCTLAAVGPASAVAAFAAPSQSAAPPEPWRHRQIRDMGGAQCVASALAGVVPLPPALHTSRCTVAAVEQNHAPPESRQASRGKRRTIRHCGGERHARPGDPAITTEPQPAAAPARRGVDGRGALTWHRNLVPARLRLAEFLAGTHGTAAARLQSSRR